MTDEELHELINELTGNRQYSDKEIERFPRKFLAKMTDEEQGEAQNIVSEGRVLNIDIDKIRQRQYLLDSRRNALKAKMRINHNLSSIEHLRFDAVSGDIHEVIFPEQGEIL